MSQKVQCPYMDCEFKTSVYTAFNAHKSKNHNGRQIHSRLQFKPGILIYTENLLDVDVYIAGTEMENDIQDEIDFQEDDKLIILMTWSVSLSIIGQHSF